MKSGAKMVEAVSKIMVIARTIGGGSVYDCKLSLMIATLTEAIAEFYRETSETIDRLEKSIHNQSMH